MKKKQQLQSEERGAGFPTPVYDFVRKYAESKTARLHMPGHKGKSFLGCEPYDLTEIEGVDSLYNADGIIAESERNAAKLFDTAATFYSTEGSSHCIRAMLAMALMRQKEKRSQAKSARPVIAAARNVHKSFLSAAALLDFDIVWLWPEPKIKERLMEAAGFKGEEERSVCSCPISAETVAQLLADLENPPAAVYLTSPDYLGGMADIAEIARVCHAHGTLLLADNAHGAYLHFLEKSLHPMDLGADLCCDSAHKTLPVLTGGAYLHVGRKVPELARFARGCLSLFGSTSPSYLTMASLDLCNAYLADGYRKRLANFIERLDAVKTELRNDGYCVRPSDPLRLVIDTPQSGSGITGFMLAEKLRQAGGECEFADPDYFVLMLTPENKEEDLSCILRAFSGERLGENADAGDSEACGCDKRRGGVGTAAETPVLLSAPAQRKAREPVCSVREAMLSPQETVPAAEAVGRVCGMPRVSCPPAVPIVMPGERIEEADVRAMRYYGYQTVQVVRFSTE